MKPTPAGPRLRPSRVAAWLALAVAVHLLAVWAAPRLIMQRVLAQLPPAAPGQAVLPPMTDHLQRRVVMPSPDLLYALCPFDLAAGPLRVRADPAAAGVTGYWSVAVYAGNSDNVFVLNDRAAAGRPVDLLLQHAGNAAAAGVVGAVNVPTSRGLVLMRVLVDPSAGPAAPAEAARRSLRCDVADRTG